ncbi:MAG: trypsin-like peptidase domain-containing protein [Christensenellaceae bacterium]|nr:trypsin-like peptidase domain-containing protein [Christensenellaceae bacterium]
MYNDYNNNGGYNNNQSDFYGANNNNYRGYNPYEQPNNGYNNGGNNNGRKKRGKAWLIILLIVLGVIVVSTLSIGIFSAVTGQGTELDKPMEWQEPEQDTDDNAGDKQEPEKETLASEGTSDKYSFVPSTTNEGEMNPQQVAEKLIPSVVCIQNYQKVVYENQNFFGQGRLPFLQNESSEELTLYGEGSGIIITEDGYIATNAHVIDDADILKVVMSDDEIYEAKLVGIDSDTDLAVIKIEAQGLKKAEIGTSNDLKVGQYVMAIGNPGGLEFSSSVTLGIASSVDRPLALSETGYTMTTIQTDASINPGNSGGALVNLKGQVVGICSAKYVASGYEGLGFAITIDEALPIIKDLMDYGKVQNRSMLGVNGQMLDEVTAKYYDLKEGFYVHSITNENAGKLKGGDVITAVNGTQITVKTNIKDIIKGMPPGTVVEIEFYRSADEKTYTTDITLMEYNTED